MQKRITSSIAWNCLLITVGSFLFAFGIKAIAFPHGLITGGLFGTALFLNYLTGIFDPNVIFIILNLPLFIVGYLIVSKRFFLYTLLGVVLITVFYQLITFELDVTSDLYAALAAGMVTGLGAGITLRSLGSGGGLDIIAVVLHSRWSISFGRFFFTYHLILFSLCFLFFDVDLCISSIIMVFVSATVVDEVVSSFSRRKVVYIVSDKNIQIARAINNRLKRGATFITAHGAFSGGRKDILMTVINNIQLKRLENLVFTHDPDALFIVENTFSVLGKTFAGRKAY